MTDIKPAGQKKSTRAKKNGIPPVQQRRVGLDELDHAIIKAIMSMPGASVEDLCEHVNISPSAYYERKKRFEFQAALTNLTKTSMDIIQETQIRAARRLARLIESSDENIAMKAVTLALTPMLDPKIISLTQNNNSQSMVFTVQYGENGAVQKSAAQLKAEELATKVPAMPEGTTNDLVIR